MPLEIIRNDITSMAVDAIVNSAEPGLLGGGGVDGSIHKAAGPELLEECRSLGGCGIGQAKITGGYGLPCRYVIHTVGPVWRGGLLGEREKLASCYRESLTLAKERGLETVAFPLISSGVFGYPKDKALRVAVDTIGEFLMENDMLVYLVVYGSESFSIGRKLFSNIARYIDDNYVSQHRDEVCENRRFIMEESFRADYDMADCTVPDCAKAPPLCAAASAPRPSFQKAMPFKENPVGIPPELIFDQLDAGFSETLLKLIDLSGKKDSEIYKRANIDRKLFSKIRNNPNYKPSKTTALAFAVALQLDIAQTQDFIGRAGYTLSRSSKADIIVEYFIREGVYDLFKINEALFAFDQSLLGG